MTDLGAQNKIWSQLDRLQHQPVDRCIVFRPVPCGLGGQITGRVQTLSLALGLGRKAVFLTLEDPPYHQTFDPLFSCLPTNINLDDAELVDPFQDQQAPIVCYDPSRMTITTPKIDVILLAKIKKTLGVEIDNRLVLEGMVFNWMRLANSMRVCCDVAKERLGVDKETLGVHFRRGDKAVETAFVPASVFNSHIAKVYNTWPFKAVFLASDSPYAPREIELPPSVRLIFDDQEQRYNNANHKMLMDSPKLAKQETHVAFKNIALLAACGGIIGQDNAHFATLAAGSIMARDKRNDRVVLIDGRIAEQQSLLLSRFFRLKKWVRGVGRRMFPWLTMAERIKKREPVCTQSSKVNRET